MITRKLSDKVLSLARQYPVITITGPRQSGKTTFCKMVFPQKAYVTLESLDNRVFAKEDPRGFLDQFENGVVIDEIQNVPELTSYIQEYSDRINREGFYILTGSHNFAVMDSVSQSLAGRTAIIKLLPFSFSEIYPEPDQALNIESVLYTGFYPRIFDKNLNPGEAMSYYVNTYLERDLRKMINIKDLSRFEIFLKLCAGRSAQILNLSSFSTELGIHQNTVKAWLSILEASYIIKILRPYYKNFNKRLVKAPKLYFLDTALACYLLDITKKEYLSTHPLKGALFESFVVAEVLKQRFNTGKPDNLYYFRDNNGREIDLLLDYALEFDQMEIKSGKTINSGFFKNLTFLRELGAPVRNSILLYGGDSSRKQSGHQVLGWKEIGCLEQLY